MYPLLLRLGLACIGGLVAVFLFSGLRSTSIPDLATFYSSPSNENVSTVLTDASNRTLGFQKLFVIDIPSQPEIRDAVSLAAALTPDGGLKIEYIDNTTANTADPSSIARDPLRGHMDALRTIVERKISSALVIEASMEWRENIKAQMQDLASAARSIVQPDLLDSERLTLTSPYGNVDLWDALLLNYCGVDTVELGTKKGVARVMLPRYTSEPESSNAQHGDQQSKDGKHELKRAENSGSKACPLAYGVTQRGARRFLLSLMERPMDYTMDSVMNEVCDGYDNEPKHNCIASEHQIFQTRGLKSDGGDWQYNQVYH